MKSFIVFECDFCKRHYKRKINGEKHEKVCYLNPGVKSCLTCKNLSYGDFANGKISNESYICEAGAKPRVKQILKSEWCDNGYMPIEWKWNYAVNCELWEKK